MSPELEALARRAIACKGWRWVPGQPIVDSHGVRGYVVDIAPLPEPGAWVANRAGVAWLSAEEMGRCLPDLTDPATLGCLLALVREAHGQPHATVHWCWEFDANHPTHVAERGLPRRMWAVDDIHDWREASATSEAAALVAALEAAP